MKIKNILLTIILLILFYFIKPKFYFSLGWFIGSLVYFVFLVPIIAVIWIVGIILNDFFNFIIQSYKQEKENLSDDVERDKKYYYEYITDLYYPSIIIHFIYNLLNDKEKLYYKIYKHLFKDKFILSYLSVIIIIIVIFYL
jgi:hypothetical protein